jgi:hypothetical protein
MQKIIKKIENVFRNNKKINIFYLFLFVILFVILFVMYSLFIRKNIENFDAESAISSTLSSSSSSSNIQQKYNYLEPIPPNTIWSSDTQTSFVNKWNSVHDLSGNNALTTGELQMNPFPIMSYATETEAEYYIQNGNWPYDDFVNNYIQTDASNVSTQEIQMYQSAWPNRFFYINFVAPNVVPFYKTLLSFEFNYTNKANNNQWYQCQNGNLYTGLGDASGNLNWNDMSLNTDYTFFENNITNFKFTNQPCNPCSIFTINDPQAHSLIDLYDSSANTCKFTVGTNPDDFNVYTGQPLSVSTTTFKTSGTTVDNSSTTDNTDSGTSNTTTNTTSPDANTTSPDTNTTSPDANTTSSSSTSFLSRFFKKMSELF